MNALLLKKEIRILSPSFIAALVVALFSGLAAAFASARIGEPGFSATTGVISQILFLLCPVLVIFMAIQSFGAEINVGTLPNLLAQPIARTTVWRMKTVLLGAGILMVWLIWWTSFVTNQNHLLDFREDLRPVLVMTICFALAFYSGGLWTVLLLRQVAAAFWFTLLIPAVITLPIVSLAQKFPKSIEPTLAILLGLYSVAGFIFARRLFLRAQDVQWTGGNIALPEFRRAEKSRNASSAEPVWRPRAALFFKEIQLHQSQFVVAGVLALLHFALALVRKFGGEITKQPAMEIILAGFWTLWFVIPMLVGCAAVSEERKLGTLESQLCLPVRRRTQFWIKFGCALLLSVVFGFLMPLLFEGKRILPAIEIKAAAELAKNFPNDSFVQSVCNVLLFIGQILPILILLGSMAVILTVSFYASTLSRNTLQSLAPSVLGIALAFTILFGAGDVEKVFHCPLWRGWLIYIIGVPILTLAIYGLMEWNFKNIWIGWRAVGRRNVTVLVAALGGVTFFTTTIYHRAWEYFAPLESAHGVARLEKSTAYEMQSWGWRSTILLPDGRAWSAWPSFGSPGFASVFLNDWNLELKSGGFWNGTNWKSVASSYFDDVGIKADGSLWVSEEPRKPDEFRKVKYPAQPLVRVGDGNDWKSVLDSYRREAFLLKKDGTLWIWGENVNDKKKGWPGLRAFEPKQLGTDSNWVEILQVGYKTAFRKTNGETWIYPPMSQTSVHNIKLNDEISVERAEYLDGLKSTARVSLHSVTFLVGTDNNQKILMTADWRRMRIEFNLVKERVPFGTGFHWLTVAGDGQTVVALKTDGSLWKWKFPDNPITNPNSASAVRLGNHSDWIAIADQFGGVTSLAADGSLWFWRSDDPRYSSSAAVIPPLLAASRKPLKIGNIFDAPPRQSIRK